jgi:hypothetical protein
MDLRLKRSVTAMRIAFGLTATLAGLDKFFNILADWAITWRRLPRAFFRSQPTS